MMKVVWRFSHKILAKININKHILPILLINFINILAKTIKYNYFRILSFSKTVCMIWLKFENYCSLHNSGVATRGQGGQSATPVSEKLAKIQEKEGKNREKRGKIGKNRQKSGRFFHLAPPDRKGWLHYCCKSQIEQLHFAYNSTLTNNHALLLCKCLLLVSMI